MSEPATSYPVLSPYLAVRNADRAIEFYQRVLRAQERFRLTRPDTGQLCHAELLFGNSLVMLAEEFPGHNQAPETIGGSPVRLCLSVDDVDDTIERARAAGATVTMEPANTFYGYRSGAFRDPFGHLWMVQRDVEHLSQTAMQERWQQMCSKPQPQQ